MLDLSEWFYLSGKSSLLLNLGVPDSGIMRQVDEETLNRHSDCVRNDSIFKMQDNRCLNAFVSQQGRWGKQKSWWE